MNCDKKDLLLYAVTDRAWLGNQTLCQQVEMAILGGATVIQHREKELTTEAFLDEAQALRKLCAKHNVPLIINDNVDVAKRVNADGVHLGQGDMCAADARKILGKDKIVGVSAVSVEQAIAAEKAGADYLGVGAVFPTGSKNDAQSVSLDTLKEICDAVSIPVVAIGGISKHNLDKLSGSGICGVAVISAIFASEDIKAATAELAHLTERLVSTAAEGIE